MVEAAPAGPAESDYRFQSSVSAVRWGAEAIRKAVAEDLDGAGDPESLARRESQWLLEAAAVAAGRDPLFIRQPELTSRVIAVFRSHVARRSRGEPLAYVIGEASFRGFDLIVTPDVLIPRPETEQLVELALEAIRGIPNPRILDLGTGSGAIAVALAVEKSNALVTAVDISESARLIAARNAARHGVAPRVEISAGDIFPEDEGGRERYHLLVANLPYIPDEAELPAAVAAWEPRGALRGGPRGDELIERAIAGASSRLLPGATLLFETGEEQAGALAARHPEYGFKALNDLTGRPRFIHGRTRTQEGH